MEPALYLLGLAATVGVVAGACRRLGWPAPPVLVVAGILGSFLPFVPQFELDADIVLFGLLPPLLYAAAIRTSLVDFRANTYSILLLSVGAVIVTTLAVGAVAWWVLPGLTLAAAFALGAVVAPPDAVAATAIARRVGLPRRIVTILEGESLVNDATALVALTVSITAITEVVTPGEIAWEAVRAAGGGLLIGVAAAAVLSFIRKRIDDPVLDTLLSFLAPWVAFLPAEAIHSSGVLSVVVAGLILGHKAPVLQSARSRITETVNWTTVQFLLENVVFLLIGLQLRWIVEGVADLEASWMRAGAVCLAVLVATVAVRFAYVFGLLGLHALGAGAHRAGWSAANATIVSWAAMRGVVTLAAAFLLPPETPQRPILLLAAFAVVAGTLLGFSPTLPWLVRRLGVRGPDAAEDALRSPPSPTRPRVPASPAWTRSSPPTTRPRWSPSCTSARCAARTRCGSAWAAPTRSRSPRRPPTRACECRCCRPSARRSWRAATPASSTTRCCARPWPASTSRRPSSTAWSRRAGAWTRPSWPPPPAAPATASTCAPRPSPTAPPPPAPARSACATAPAGCTCASAWSAATWAAATPP
ncbi:MAG: cation:proton antiporter, partial [Thermoleophilia bacterium]